MGSILVTGGAGYIGSHVVRVLFRGGFDVVVVDDLTLGHKSAVSNVPLVQAEIWDEEVMSNVIKEYDVDAVMHFAARSQVGESMQQPRKYYHNNVRGTISFLQILLDQGVRHFVFSSSAAVYGDTTQMPISEQDQLTPTSVYGRTKLMIEQILADYASAYEFSYTALRYFNAAGADHSAQIGEDHRPETHLIPIIMQVLLGKRDKLQIYGTDYDTIDGTCVRDYIHVNDLADAHILALESLRAGSGSGAFNLGNGDGFSVKQVVNAVEKVTGSKIAIQEAARRAGDPSQLIASSALIKKELGWKPKYDSLDEIVSTAWNWHRTHPDGYID